MLSTHVVWGGSGDWGGRRMCFEFVSLSSNTPCSARIYQIAFLTKLAFCCYCCCSLPTDSSDHGLVLLITDASNSNIFYLSARAGVLEHTPFGIPVNWIFLGLLIYFHFKKSGGVFLGLYSNCGTFFLRPPTRTLPSWNEASIRSFQGYLRCRCVLAVWRGNGVLLLSLHALECGWCLSSVDCEVHPGKFNANPFGPQWHRTFLIPFEVSLTANRIRGILAPVIKLLGRRRANHEKINTSRCSTNKSFPFNVWLHHKNVIWFSVAESMDCWCFMIN